MYVGRLEPLKGMELLLHTAAQMDSCDEMRVLVVGGDANGGQEVDRLKNIAKKLNVEDMFDFVGRVDQEELPLYYNAADVCVVPSYYESFGLAALESMGPSPIHRRSFAPVRAVVRCVEPSRSQVR